MLFLPSETLIDSRLLLVKDNLYKKLKCACHLKKLKVINIYLSSHITIRRRHISSWASTCLSFHTLLLHEEGLGHYLPIVIELKQKMPKLI